MKLQHLLANEVAVRNELIRTHGDVEAGSTLMAP